MTLLLYIITLEVTDCDPYTPKVNTFLQKLLALSSQTGFGRATSPAQPSKMSDDDFMQDSDQEECVITIFPQASRYDC